MIFRKRTAAELMSELLREAEVEAVLHQASAEHHQALATMYADRASKLRAALDEQPRTLAEAIIDTAAPPPSGRRLAPLQRFAPAGLRP
jgi:uncharacterized protein with beta-barrel porin domain